MGALSNQVWHACQPMAPALPLRPGLRHVPQAPLHKATSTSPANGGGFAVFVAVHESLRGTKLPFAAFKTTSAFWGTAVEKCSL